MARHDDDDDDDGLMLYMVKQVDTLKKYRGRF